MDPEDLRDLQLRYQRAALTAMEDYGGFVASYSGDGILVYFGYPTAHENDAERAARAALELVKLVPDLEVKTVRRRRRLSRFGSRAFRLLVIGSEMHRRADGYGVIGEAVNLASRLKDEAPVNSVVVTRRPLSLSKGFSSSAARREADQRFVRPIAVRRSSQGQAGRTGAARSPTARHRWSDSTKSRQPSRLAPGRGSLRRSRSYRS